MDTTDIDNALATAALYNSAIRMVLTRGEEGDPDAIPVALHLIRLQDVEIEAASKAVIPLYSVPALTEPEPRKAE